eukprot:1158928-Pelagomonas_calceolata.AAC.1
MLQPWKKSYNGRIIVQRCAAGVSMAAARPCMATANVQGHHANRLIMQAVPPACCLSSSPRKQWGGGAYVQPANGCMWSGGKNIIMTVPANRCMCCGGS